jgi:diguanylate cyclase (GGDEF)-like protein
MGDNSQPIACTIPNDTCPLRDELEQLQRENRDLKGALRTDMLTGLYNYRQLQQVLALELERTRRTRTPTALLMIDVDHFKQVNDRWGHEVGNQALRHIAGCIRRAIRRLDIPCRYGGEEFAVVLPATPLAEAVSVAERIRAAIEDATLQHEQGELPLTASIGVGVFRSGMSSSAESLLQLADRYLYQAKAAGRNRIAHPELPPSTEVSADERAALFS